MAASDAVKFPRKNVAYRIYFPMLDNTGAGVAAPTIDSGLASGSGKAILSKDGGAVANSTNSVTTISGSYGWHYLDVTSTEGNADADIWTVRTTTTDAKNAYLAVYMDEDGDIRVNVAQIAGATAAVPGAAGGVFIAGTNAATAVTTSFTTTFTGNLTGSVASVTGAVGSVTGAVGSVTGAVGSVTGSVGSVTGAVGSVTGNVGGSVASVTALASGAVDAIIDDAVEGSTTLRQAIRLMLAALTGKLSGAATTTVSVRDVADSKNRIVATVDASGNRSAVTLDAS